MDTPHLVAAGAESNYTPTRNPAYQPSGFLLRGLEHLQDGESLHFWGFVFAFEGKKEKKDTEKCSPSEMGQFCPFGDFMRYCHMCGTGRVSG